MRLVAWVLPQLENEGQDKRVESVWFPCADEGSTPSSSTMLRQRGLTLVRVLRKRSDYVDYDSLQLHYVTPSRGLTFVRALYFFSINQ